MLVIKEVSSQEQYEDLKVKQDTVKNSYLYILKYNKQNIFVNKDGEYVLGNSDEVELLKQEVDYLSSILDTINRVVI